MDAIRVKSWSEAMAVLYPRAPHRFSERYRSSNAFRGLADASWPLRTSYQRLPVKSGYREKVEGHLLRNFRTYATDGGGKTPHDADRSWSDWRWLTVAQHHGLPTRLLDWTHSPLVALHFATAETEHFGVDGAVWVCARAKANYRAPAALRDPLREADTGNYTLAMLEQLVPSLSDFDRMAKLPFLIFYEPPSIDARIVNQAAMFSVMSDRDAAVDEWLEQQECDLQKVVIDQAAKLEIRDKLDQSGVTERVLFPGLDGLSAWIKRHFTAADALRPKPAPGKKRRRS
ncbi:MAG: FRG domain-containing protein [Planctomycetes bacterium]|nr:FRG domain-containing protein [Planctomycetota bacterium]